MTTDEQIHLKYPIGKFTEPGVLNAEQIQIFTKEIEVLPSYIEEEYKKIRSNGLIEAAYRPDGWTARQVVHHLADSHMNALIRFKLALTEDNPTIKPYKEDRWANLADTRDLDPEIAVQLLKIVHQKLGALIRTMSVEDFSRTYFHPESQKQFKLETVLALYAWHGKHHLGHLRIINSQSTTI